MFIVTFHFLTQPITEIKHRMHVMQTWNFVNELGHGGHETESEDRS